MGSFGPRVLAKGEGAFERRNRPRDTSRPVVLIGFLEDDNLGLSYLAAMLRAHDYRCEIIDISSNEEEILRVLRDEAPLIVGFSLIFQFYLPRFAGLARALRAQGISNHFTIGGHFPSLSYRETLELIPDLDSVARFEGEETLLELADVLSVGGDWREIVGLAYTRGGEVTCNPLRPLVADLDTLPLPARSFKDKAFLGRRSTPILASRGCIRTCAFCSIHMFYRAAPGKVVRTRSPRGVADEMEMLHREHDVSLFLFQDDDFPVFGAKWRQWALAFCEEIDRRGLSDRILWKISCRADAVEEALFARMRRSGLYLVYMGLESGNEDGLSTLNKRITVEQNLRAVETLKRLSLRFEFGFMLFEPATTFETVRADLAFLRRVVGDGATAASFCRMVPYDGTPIKEELMKAGRLQGDVRNPYYDFLDPKLTEFCNELGRVLEISGWTHGLESVTQTLNVAWSEFAVMERLFPYLPGIENYRERLLQITHASNDLLFKLVAEMADAFANGGSRNWSPSTLKAQCEGFKEAFLTARNAIVFGNQDLILGALSEREKARAARR